MDLTTLLNSMSLSQLKENGIVPNKNYCFDESPDFIPRNIGSFYFDVDDMNIKFLKDVVAFNPDETLAEIVIDEK